MIAAGQSDYVKQYLWTGDNNKYHGGVIKYDLDCVVGGYKSDTCDLWEDLRDADLFWNRATMKKAMILGANFATSMGDSNSANSYINTRNAINSTLHNHYNGQFYEECKVRTYDGAVIVTFNDAFDESDGMFAPTDLEVANTVSAYNNLYCSM